MKKKKSRGSYQLPVKRGDRKSLECLGLASPLPISGASVAPLCVFPRLPVIHAGVLVRALVIVARVSITRSLGELFASDSNEKDVSGMTEGRDREKSGRKERRVAQVFALVSSFWVDTDQPHPPLDTSH